MWHLLVCDRLGNQLGELRNAHDRSLKFSLNRTPTLGCRIDVDNPMAQYLQQLDLMLIKAYDDATGTRTLRYIGPVTNFEKDRGAQQGSIAITSAGVAWRLQHRLIGKNPAGAKIGTASSKVDRGEIAGQILDALNQGNSSSIHADAGDTGIRRGTITASSSTYVGPWHYKPAAEVLSELAAPLDGFDWEIAPVEPTVDATGLQIGALNIAAAFGQLRPDAVFEFGPARNNVASFRDLGDANGLANRLHNLPQGFPDTATQQVVSQSDGQSINERGLHEAVVPGDLVVNELRQKLVDEHSRIRKVPRRVITFEPIRDDATDPETRRVPQLFVDYIVGDVVPFRATESFPIFSSAGIVIGREDVKTVDVLMRIYGADVRLDDNGVPTTALTLVEEG